MPHIQNSGQARTAARHLMAPAVLPLPQEQASAPHRHRLHYVIYAPDYSQDVGGIMALHTLCDALVRIGARASIWPFNIAPPPSPSNRWEALKLAVRNFWNPPQPVKLISRPQFMTPVATPGDLRRAVVIYPEVVEGNPLGAKRVVRWFLNKPGRLTGKTGFGPKDLCFFFQEAFNDPDINPHPDHKLMLITVLDDVYRVVNTGPRSGTCYILRKGKARVPDPQALDGIVIDGKSHAEIAAIFNACEYCVSYDSYTMYSYYASMAGCKSVVVPEPGVTKAEWQPVEDLTYGIAYGFEDVDRAERTRPQMISYFQQQQQDNLKAALGFCQKCETYFLPTS